MSCLSSGRALRRALAALPVLGLLAAVSVLSSLSAMAQTPPPPPPPPDESDTAGTPPASPTAPTPGAPTTPAPTPPTAGGNAPGGGRYLLLPDISFNGVFLGHLSTDKRDQTRERFRLDEGEVGIQSYVYPDVKLDTFIVFAGEGGVSVEEAYLTYLNAPFFHLPMSAVLGRRKVPFGRVNQLHPHSWLYAVQPYVLTNLVSEESLTGDGAYLSYLLPTGKLFSQLDVGFYTQSEPTGDITIPTDPASQIVTSPGAGFADKFSTARLVVAQDMLGGSMEFGGSIAGGRGVAYSLAGEGAPSVRPDILLSGADVTYRRSGTGAKRLLLRSEYLQHRQTDHQFHNAAAGYYFFADQKVDPLTSYGIRYDSSGFPYASGKERGVSLIGTHALTEATFYRMQFLHGDRPGKRNFNELFFEVVFGAGPHTHNLE